MHNKGKIIGTTAQQIICQALEEQGGGANLTWGLW